MEENQREMLTRREMMQLLKLSATGFWRAERAKQLPPAILVGARKRWSVDTVNKWIEEQERQGR